MPPLPAHALSAAKHLLRTFHTREPRRTWETPWKGPVELWCVGRGVQLCYSSDKADPGDSTDRAGTWRGYYHDQESSTLVYVTPAEGRRLLGARPPAEVIRPQWPEVVCWLGSADEYDLLVDGKGKRHLRLGGGPNKRGLQLWAFPCARHRGCYDLLAAPASGNDESRCVLWCGPRLTVEHVGIKG